MKSFIENKNMYFSFGDAFFSKILPFMR